MAHYAFLDENNIVVTVIVGRDEDDTTGGVTDWEAWYGDFRGQTCKRTSYNTYFGLDDGVARHRLGGTPFRGKYACIGDTYDEQNNVFIPYGWSYDAVNDIFVAPTVEESEEE
ncbi:MAG: hypothetical protein FJ187_08720 [Gammaproteobacteria bacterium]|nr:hypothetical protein [Gammaproteobacteria bacterium]